MSVHVCVKEGTPGEGRIGKELVQCVARSRSTTHESPGDGRVGVFVAQGLFQRSLLWLRCRHGRRRFCQVIMDRMDFGPEHRPFGIRGSGVEVALPHAWLLDQLSCADIPSVPLLR